ncbi:MAG: TlyA family RNA methyltransferase [Christensenellales bacterium]|jgi:23S rRNA (cytidine1920-2'-O)/16S rRNA (cytidine1409-2'-O)-methyltransferase
MRGKSRQRLDSYLAEQGYFESREKARIAVMAGDVLVNDRSMKPSYEVKETDRILVKEKQRYVSRGGYKLEKALEVFQIDLTGKLCADIGASTGGFTDCMLQQGASRVYCVDVGYGQLHYKLRSDARVVVMERTNARLLTPDAFDVPLAFVSVDVSFISLKLVLPPISACLDERGEIVALIKPQFEAGRNAVGKNGVVREASVHIGVIGGIVEAVEQMGLIAAGLDFSPIKGPEGNIEFLLHVKKQPGVGLNHAQIESCVAAAHGTL